jgi:hypothetical protein
MRNSVSKALPLALAVLLAMGGAVFAVEVTGIDPAEGPAAGGLTVTITGTDFEDGATPPSLKPSPTLLRCCQY